MRNAGTTCAITGACALSDGTRERPPYSRVVGANAGEQRSTSQQARLEKPTLLRRPLETWSWETTRNHLIPEWRIKIRLEPHEPWFLTDVGQCRVAISPWGLGGLPKGQELACSPISHPTTDGNCAQPSASWQASNGVIGRAISSHDIKQHGDNKNDARRVF